MKENNLKILFLVGASILITGSFGTAFAQSSYIIKIPTGASDPNAPFFWQSEKDGSTTGTIEILRGDTVVWSNADTAPHTVTSGTPEDGPDEKFDSGLFEPGKSFILKFENTGTFPYFCIIHPWMDGEVIVTEGFSILPDVGKTVTDGEKSFDVEYKFSRLIDNPQINVDQKSITFELVGNSKSTNHDLTMKLPSELLDGPYVIWVDGQKLSEFQHEKENEMNTLVIPLTEKSKTITIVGTFVIPEFGTVAIMILSVAIISVVAFTAKSRLNLRV